MPISLWFKISACGLEAGAFAFKSSWEFRVFSLLSDLAIAFILVIGNQLLY